MNRSRDIVLCELVHILTIGVCTMLYQHDLRSLTQTMYVAVWTWSFFRYLALTPAEALTVIFLNKNCIKIVHRQRAKHTRTWNALFHFLFTLPTIDYVLQEICSRY